MNVIYPPGVQRKYDPNYPIDLTVWFFAEESFRLPRKEKRWWQLKGDPLFDTDILIMVPATSSFWVSVARIA